MKRNLQKCNIVCIKIDYFTICVSKIDSSDIIQIVNISFEKIQMVKNPLQLVHIAAAFVLIY